MSFGHFPRQTAINDELILRHQGTGKGTKQDNTWTSGALSAKAKGVQTLAIKGAHESLAAVL